MKNPVYDLTPFSKFYTHICISFCLVSLAEYVISPHLMCYFTELYYGPKFVDPKFVSRLNNL